MFLQKPLFEIGKQYRWVLASECIYFSEKYNLTVTIPPGFETDLASIPRIPRLLFPVNDKHRLAAVMHDYLYTCRGVLPSGYAYTRRRADAIFFEAMEDLGVSWIKKHTMYCAVRLAGRLYWPG